jgi:hypothetical protein
MADAASPMINSDCVAATMSRASVLGWVSHGSCSFFCVMDFFLGEAMACTISSTEVLAGAEVTLRTGGTREELLDSRADGGGGVIRKSFLCTPSKASESSRGTTDRNASSSSTNPAGSSDPVDDALSSSSLYATNFVAVGTMRDGVSLSNLLSRRYPALDGPGDDPYGALRYALGL